MANRKVDDLWVVTVYIHTDIPRAEHYAGAERLKNGWKVNYCGGKVLIRDALERKFFVLREHLDDYFKSHLDRKRNIHIAAVREIEAAMIVGVFIHNKPKDRPKMLDQKLKLSQVDVTRLGEGEGPPVE